MEAMRRETGGVILVVDDEQAIVQFIRDALVDEGYTVFCADDGAQALRAAQAHRPDLAILDIMLPGDDGYTVCQALRARWDIPILFLSARQDDVDKIRGFSVGADDFVSKPFSIRELLARVEAHLRRQRRDLQRIPTAQTTYLRFGALALDLSAYEARYAGEPIALTRKEFEILHLLALHPHQVFSRETIYTRIWGMDSLGNTDTVTEHIKRIRQKIAQRDPQTDYICTVWGVGYKWERSRST